MSSSRRRFIQQSGALGAGFWIAGRQSAFAQEKSANAKVNIAAIGSGGQGGSNLNSITKSSPVNITALCDIDEQRLGEAVNKFNKDAKKYTDFRKMLEECNKDIDGVIVATPDHNHAVAAAMAMKMGKAAYVEKPLTHSIYEARTLTELARKHKVATQMGNHGHSSGSRRRLVDFLRQGGIGKVKEVHAWTNRPIWPQGLDRPTGTKEIPKHIHWDQWLGPAPERPYHDAYLHFKWRGWWDFGTGALGDMACHIMDAAFWGLDLGYPSAVETEGDPLKPDNGPKWMTVKLDFPARGEQPPVKYTWYDGDKGRDENGVRIANLPPNELVKPLSLYRKDEKSGKDRLAVDNGNIIVGEKGTIFVTDEQTGNWQVIVDGKPVDKKEIKVEKKLPDSPGHHLEWVNAIKGGPAALGNFDYSGPFTETVLIGIAVFRANKGKITWDGPNMKATNCPEMDPFIKREYRAGWSL